ncbi:MAG: putative toxin-antitoxin system toxin component, PIN family [Chromatiales bacterium]|nr:putative toxin-antitoxin system toxin component, PIN family [Chromatiales bacterium]
MQDRIVLDTNVLIAAVRSRRGASWRLLSLIGTGQFEISISVPLILEYEAVLLKQMDKSTMDRGDLNGLLDYLVSEAHHQEIYFLWRPQSRDPKDDMVLELAVASGANRLVTHNVRDFRAARDFDVRVVTPGSYLFDLGTRP